MNHGQLRERERERERERDLGDGMKFELNPLVAIARNLGSATTI